MKFLKLISLSTIALSSLLVLETKAAIPSDYSQLNTCTHGGKRYYKLQKTDEPASYGVWNDTNGTWAAQYVSYNSATSTYQNKCNPPAKCSESTKTLNGGTCPGNNEMM